ncbi:YjdF family protein [Staphylococcus kloosii]|uniref:YjdF family protein n=1 Tax=Staphylococcus kloosii TaxID=29384 RepID=UPI000D1E2D70|nr:YjdF family protein [Staphylococcus kloosii]PTJ74940.1 DUF2992 domain-containing protein [Staphylococcus kloosii]
MDLSLFHNGQFFVALVEYKTEGKSKFVKYTFGTEPNDEQILNFIHYKLLPLLNATQTTVDTKVKSNKVNPKRIQRQVVKAQRAHKDITKAQLAIKEEQQLHKKQCKKLSKAKKDAFKARKRKIKREKAKAKHKGK